MKKINGNKGKTDEKRPNLLLLIVAISLAVLLLFGIVLGGILLAREISSVASFGGVYIDEGVASFLASSFKYQYLVALGEEAFDSELFWGREIEEGVTYGDMLKEECENYIRGILVGAYLYNMTKSLSATEREYLDTNTREVLEYRANSSVAEFNRMSAEMGFDYDDFCVGTELIYKAVAAKNVLYGTNGSELKAGGYFGDTNTYYSTFSRVRMLIIRTEEDFVVENGEVVRDSSGQYKTYTLSATDKLQRQNDIDEIRRLIEGANKDYDEQMSPYYFSEMLEKYNPYDDFKSSGYYFSNMSEYTAGFATEVSAANGFDDGLGDRVIEASMSLPLEGYGEVEYSGGVIFLYKMPLDEYAYLNPDYEVFFTDFYPDAANYLYMKSLDDYSPMVNLKDNYYKIDILTLPYNSQFVIKGTA